MNEDVKTFNEYLYQSENINELADALSKAQGSWSAPKKDKTASFPTKSGARISYDYADLTSIIENSKGHLKENGLSVTQKTVFKNNLFVLETVLMHSSGQWTKSHYPLPNPTTMKPQDFGSHLTYARRYSFCAVTNISADADDDANLAQGNNAQISNRQKQQRQPQNMAPRSKPVDKTPPPPPNSMTSQDFDWDNLSTESDVYVFRKGKFSGQPIDKVNKKQLEEWVAYMADKGFTKGQDFKEAAQYLG